MNTPPAMNPTSETESVLFFDHPYPRYGLAVTLVEQGKTNDWRALLEDPKTLVQMAGPVVEAALGRFRVHTHDDLDEDRTLRYRYLSNEELETSGQKAEDGYYISPHVVIEDRPVRYLIKEARGFLEDVDEGIDPFSSTKLKRSFAPFTVLSRAREEHSTSTRFAAQ